ncbi:hypothetical protein ACFFJT_06555 [Dyella flava]|uniref:Uncharacterized protein n=1 Tax=Dyella flava TaxID=1920170 RepID=A0ABS2K040_9GAMM|nr:hypothetical protein [Dyella flava]MBM7124108.1 hypothetical protein [Dyella flava]GLQ50009.1 hypothetical protein GCM10010872_14580 [Dyella flava]
MINIALMARVSHRQPGSDVAGFRDGLVLGVPAAITGMIVLMTVSMLTLATAGA